MFEMTAKKRIKLFLFKYIVTQVAI